MPKCKYDCLAQLTLTRYLYSKDTSYPSVWMHFCVTTYSNNNVAGTSYFVEIRIFFRDITRADVHKVSICNGDIATAEQYTRCTIIFTFFISTRIRTS